MKRRAVLATVSTSVAVTLAGCGCRPNTEVYYDITLDEISYDSTAGEWDGQCSLWVDFSVGGDADYMPGISDGGIALYGPQGHRIGLVEFGDMMWDDVSERNRTEGECDVQGTLSRTGEFTVSAFPKYFGVWYSDENAGAYRTLDALKYTGGASEIRTVDPSQWEPVHPPDGYFPPVPTRPPVSGQRVQSASLERSWRECSDYDRQAHVDYEVRDWQFGVRGTIVPTDIQFVPRLKRVLIPEHANVLELTLEMQPYRRPPALNCDSARLRYLVGLNVTERPPEIEVTHLDVAGNQLDNYRLDTIN